MSRIALSVHSKFDYKAFGSVSNAASMATHLYFTRFFIFTIALPNFCSCMFAVVSSGCDNELFLLHVLQFPLSSLPF